MVQGRWLATILRLSDSFLGGGHVPFAEAGLQQAQHRAESFCCWRSCLLWLVVTLS